MNGKLDSHLARLNEQIAHEQSRYINAVAAAVSSVLNEYGLTLGDLFAPAIAPKAKPAKPAKPAKSAASEPAKPAKVAKTKKVAKKTTRKPPFKGPQPPKYRDPDSGSTWSGFGHAPAWIAGAKDRAPFLINGAAQ